MGSKAIELDQVLHEAPKRAHKRRIGRKLVGLGVKAGLLLTALYGTGALTERATEWGKGEFNRLRELGMSKLRTVEVVREYVDPLDHDTPTLIKFVSGEEGINWIITDAIVNKESDYRPGAFRIEPRRCEKLGIVLGSPRVPLCSSHGIMQVMGENARKFCNIDWSQLYDRRTNIKCGLTILKRNLDSQPKTNSPGTRLWEALRMYNGSGADAEAYADKVMGMIADRLLVDLNK